MKKLLKKAFDEFKNHFFIAILLDFVFILSVFFNFYFASRIIQNNVLLIYSLGEKLEGINQLLSDSVDPSVLMEMNTSLEILNYASNYIIFTTIISFVLFFLVWCFFKSLVWKYSYDTKKHLFKDFFGYLLKFSLVSLIFFVVLAPLFAILIKGMSSFVLGSAMYGFNITGFLLFSGLFFVVFLLILYLFSVVFVVLNKHKVLDAFKKGFLCGIKRPLIFLSFFGVWVLVLFILYIDRFLSSFGRGFMVIDLIFILLIFAFYRFWFSSYFKEI